MATVATIASIIKRVYKSPIQRAINNEVWVYKYFDKKSDIWNGDTWEQPVHVSRNTGVGSRTEGAILPAAGNQGYTNLRGSEKSIYGRFEVTGQAVAKASGANKGSFASVLQEEMQGLTKDTANLLNRFAVSGGTAIGWLNERRASTPTVGAADGTASAAQSWEYQGDFTPLLGAATGDITTWVRIRLYRMDTYAEITCVNSGTTAAAGDIFVAAVDQDRTNPTIDIRSVEDGAHATATDFDTAGVGMATGVADAAPILVVLHDTASTITTYATGTGAIVTGANGGPASQPVGIFGNLGLPTHFTVDRTSATGTADILQAHCLTAETALAGARTGLTIERIQFVFDEMMDQEGVTPNLLLTNAHQRSRYLGLMVGVYGASATANARFNVDAGDVGKMDLGPNQGGWSYAGIPFQVSRHYPNGGISFLTTDSWFRPTLLDGRFADEDGDILSRVGNTDVWEGFWKTYCETACKLPNHNAHLTGLTTV